jgi:hypothetical protein
MLVEEEAEHIMEAHQVLVDWVVVEILGQRGRLMQVEMVLLIQVVVVALLIEMVTQHTVTVAQVVVV